MKIIKMYRNQTLIGIFWHEIFTNKMLPIIERYGQLAVCGTIESEMAIIYHSSPLHWVKEEEA